MFPVKYSKQVSHMQSCSFSLYYIFINKQNMKNTKDVMLTLRIDKNQYITLLETLVRERKSKSTFIRESIQKSLESNCHNSCRKIDIEEWINSL